MRSGDGWWCSSRDRLLDLPPSSLFGRHQFDNAGLAVAAMLSLKRSAHRRGGHRRGVVSHRLAGTVPAADQGSPGRTRQGQGLRYLAGRGAQSARRRGPGRGGRPAAARDGRPVALIVGMFGRKDAAKFFPVSPRSDPPRLHHRLSVAQRGAGRPARRGGHGRRPQRHHRRRRRGRPDQRPGRSPAPRRTSSSAAACTSSATCWP